MAGEFRATGYRLDTMLRRVAISLYLASASFAVPALATSVHAQPAGGPGTTVVKTANDKLVTLLKAKATPAQVTQSVNDFIDIDELGKAAMSNSWSKLDKAQQTEFLKILRQLIEANYVNGMQANLAYTVNYLGESAKPNGNLVVKTTITAQRKGRPLTIKLDYELAKVAGKLKAFDIITDGVSLVDNYRTMFDKIVKDKGATALIQKMKDKLTSMTSTAPATAPAPAPAAKPTAKG
jgi:phospholipid transport system substrate-binding protein